jgi:hypothetical protein
VEHTPFEVTRFVSFDAGIFGLMIGGIALCSLDGIRDLFMFLIALQVSLTESVAILQNVRLISKKDSNVVF